MIIITARFRPKPEFVDDWPSRAKSFTDATRAEPGCLWFDWARNVEDAGEYILIEAFRDADAGAAHVQSDHFKAAVQELPQYLKSTPLVINRDVDGESWSELGELAVR